MGVFSAIFMVSNNLTLTRCSPVLLFYRSGVVACTCNPATVEAEFRNGVGSIPVGGNSPSIGGWIV